MIKIGRSTPLPSLWGVFFFRGGMVKRAQWELVRWWSSHASAETGWLCVAVAWKLEEGSLEVEKIANNTVWQEDGGLLPPAWTYLPMSFTGLHLLSLQTWCELKIWLMVWELKIENNSFFPRPFWKKIGLIVNCYRCFQTTLGLKAVAPENECIHSGPDMTFVFGPKNTFWKSDVKLFARPCKNTQLRTVRTQLRCWSLGWKLCIFLAI